ncbi:MAG TPA: calcium-translocating P-type ATPase, SERCA-type [Bacillota bacterium]|nr:calcium-translocating P-type ATPase, SERCA-type [Bacillota bacterium]HOL09688.1 calcium-translocating P-type ATPase, SERCA-type [Bacillota bacterium]HPO97277.1 calcium-translocating P-type ATPase, SERCA-type [Bacillota bacterium]
MKSDFNNPHQVNIDQLLSQLETNIQGISEQEALTRLNSFGKNVLNESAKRSFLAKLFEQFCNIMVYTLCVAAIISILLGEHKSAVIIFVVVVVNSILGVLQENKAEKALEALKSMSAPMAKVKRDGKIQLIKSEDLVPGDIVLLEAGDHIPADLRLIQVSSLQIDESMLTGESIPVEKSIDPLEDSNIAIGDRKNMAYMGCHVTYGRGIGVVTATGMKTEMGLIASQLTETTSEETPLEKKVNELTKILTIGITIMSIIIFVIGTIRGRNPFEMLLTAVGLAVAAIPEGLPAVITIVLALGVQKMAKRNAIIRKLSAVETLGCTQIICSDKTGTLTLNKMKVQEIYIDGKLSNVTTIDNNEPTNSLTKLLQIITACNDATLTSCDENVSKAIGDPTETALLEFAALNDCYKEQLEAEIPRANEIPFDSERKLMTTINLCGGKPRALTKGAPEMLLGHCTKILCNGQVEPLTNEWLREIFNANRLMGEKALRVLGVAYKELPELPTAANPKTIETGLTFVGLIGMIDPPRAEAKHAVDICLEAGIKPIMITGDHKETAVAIAKEINILQDADGVITGQELYQMTDAELTAKIEHYSVFARVSPDHKVRIVKAWKAKGKVVAMTGDGVNDAPALQAADIGVGMGITGTDVSKGVSDMVLADDNFATIVNAVEEGRKIYANIRKSIQFLISTHLGEIFTLFMATLFNWIILHPVQLLWVNLVTDSLPALALGLEKAEADIMKKRPRESEKSIFSDGIGINIIYQGITKAIITLIAFYIGKSLYSQEVANTIGFTTLGLVQLTHAFTVRSNTTSLFKLGPFSNLYLVGAFIITATLQVMVVIFTPLNAFFKVAHLTLEQWLIVAIASLTIIPIVETVKLVQSRFLAKQLQ